MIRKSSWCQRSRILTEQNWKIFWNVDSFMTSRSLFMEVWNSKVESWRVKENRINDLHMFHRYYRTVRFWSSWLLVKNEHFRLLAKMVRAKGKNVWGRLFYTYSGASSEVCIEISPVAVHSAWKCLKLISFYRASGHVDRFADLMVKDTVNGECFRLDHLIKAQLEKLCMDKKTSAGTKKECEDIITKVGKYLVVCRVSNVGM